MCIYTILSLFLLIGLVTYHFVTFGVHFLLKMTHSNTKNDPSLCIVYQVLRSAFTNEDTVTHTIDHILKKCGLI